MLSCSKGGVRREKKWCEKSTRSTRRATSLNKLHHGHAILLNNVDLTNLSLVMASRRGQSNWRRRGRGAWSEVAPVASATRGGGGGGARRGRRRGVPSRRGAEGGRSQSRGRREEQLAQLEELKHLIAATEDQLNVTLEEAMMPQNHAQHDLHCRCTAWLILLPPPTGIPASQPAAV